MNDQQTIEHRLQLIRSYINGLAEDTKAIRDEIYETGQSTQNVSYLLNTLAMADAAAELALDAWEQPPAEYEPEQEYLRLAREITGRGADFAANAAAGDRFR